MRKNRGNRTWLVSDAWQRAASLFLALMIVIRHPFYLDRKDSVRSSSLANTRRFVRAPQIYAELIGFIAC